MKKICILLFALMYYTSHGQGINNSIVRNDKDYATYYDVKSVKEKTPSSVQNKFEDVLKQLEYRSKDGSVFTYKITVDDHLDLYVMVVDCIIQKAGYIISYNQVSHEISKEAIVINLKWALNNEDGFNVKLLDYPLVKVDKNGGNYILSLKERVHNGNVYNAVITKIYSLTNNLSFESQFCFESKSLSPEGVLRKRILKDDTILVFDETDTSVNFIGKVIISKEQKKILNKESINEFFTPQLFTASGLEDQRIFDHGYTALY
jgi:hypothetical protein